MPQKSWIFQYKKQGILQKVQGYHAFWGSCNDGSTNFLSGFYSGLYAGLIYLKMVGRQPQLQTSICSACQAIQLFLLMSRLFPASFGSTSSRTSCTSCGPHGVLSGWWHCTKHDERHARTTRNHLIVVCTLLEWRTAHAGMISLHSFLSRYFQHLSSPKSQQEGAMKARRQYRVHYSWLHAAVI